MTTKEYNHQYYLKHREKHSAYMAEYRKKNPDKIYYTKHPRVLLTPEQKRANRNRYMRLRKLKDLNFKLACNLRGRVASVIKEGLKGGSSVQDLGCSVDELKLYLESKFQEGMNWDNWSRTGWHIDHIIPLAKFDLTDPVQFKVASHYTNLQPLWAEENYRKNKHDKA